MTVGTLPAMAAADDHEIQVECEEEFCDVVYECDHGMEPLRVCISWDPTSATEFVPERDTPHGADVRTRVVVHEYVVSTSVGNYVYPCGQVVADYSVQVSGNEKDGKERLPPCLGTHDDRFTYREVEQSWYVRAPDDASPGDVIRLCDARATVTVFGFGAKKVPLKHPC